MIVEKAKLSKSSYFNAAMKILDSSTNVRQRKSLSDFLSLIMGLRKLYNNCDSPSAILTEIIQKTNYIECIKSSCTKFPERLNAKIANIQMLQGLAKQEGLTLTTFLKPLLDENSDAILASESQKPITLTTIHQGNW